MNNLPVELLALIYEYDGRYKRIMSECFEIIDFRINRDKPYNSAKTQYSFFDKINYNLNKNHHKIGKLITKFK